MSNLLDLYNLASGLVLTVALPLLSDQKWPVYYKGLILVVISILLAVLKAAISNQLDFSSEHLYDTAAVIFATSQVIYQTFMKEAGEKLYNFGLFTGKTSDQPAPAQPPKDGTTSV